VLNDDFRTIHGVEPVVIQASVGDIQKIFEFSLILGNVWLHNTDFVPPLSIREDLILAGYRRRGTLYRRKFLWSGTANLVPIPDQLEGWL